MPAMSFRTAYFLWFNFDVGNGQCAEFPGPCRSLRLTKSFVRQTVGFLNR